MHNTVEFLALCWYSHHRDCMNFILFISRFLRIRGFDGLMVSAHAKHRTATRFWSVPLAVEILMPSAVEMLHVFVFCLMRPERTKMPRARYGVWGFSDLGFYALENVVLLLFDWVYSHAFGNFDMIFCFFCYFLMIFLSYDSSPVLLCTVGGLRGGEAWHTARRHGVDPCRFQGPHWVCARATEARSGQRSARRGSCCAIYALIFRPASVNS